MFIDEDENCHESKESSYIQNLELNNQYGLALSKHFFMVNLNMWKIYQCLQPTLPQNIDLGHVLIVDVEYPVYLQPLHRGLWFFA